jgi:hypothetical protein
VEESFEDAPEDAPEDDPKDSPADFGTLGVTGLGSGPTSITGSDMMTSVTLGAGGFSQTANGTVRGAGKVMTFPSSRALGW